MARIPATIDLAVVALISKPYLIEQAKQHLEELKGSRPYVCPLSDEIVPPVFCEDSL